MQSCEKFGLRMTPDESLLKSFCTFWKSGLVSSFYKKKSPYYLPRPFLSVKAIYVHAFSLWWAKSLLFRHLLPIAVAVNDYLSCLGWGMSLINYTCKGLILNWIFHWMTQVSLKASESQPSCRAAAAVILSAMRKGGGKCAKSITHICHLWNYDWMRDKSY